LKSGRNREFEHTRLRCLTMSLPDLRLAPAHLTWLEMRTIGAINLGAINARTAP